MDTQEILRVIEDPTVTDAEVFSALTDDYLADKHDANGKIIPPTPQDTRESAVVREKIIQKRPAVFQRLFDYAVEKHRYCCGPEANST